MYLPSGAESAAYLPSRGESAVHLPSGAESTMTVELMPEMFEKLNDSNWGQWRMFMRALLVKKNVWDVVSGSETLPGGSPNTKAVRGFRRKQAEAIVEITLHVDTPQLAFIQGNDPKVIWDALAAIHQA